MSKIIGPNLVTSGLVLHLDAANPKSYQSGSTSWFDMSGNNNNGTLTNGPGYSSANFGSITFDGVNDVIITPTANINSFGLTVNMWFRFQSVSANKFLFSFIGVDRYNTLTIYITTGNTLILDDRDGPVIPGGDISAIQSTSTISPNVWYNLSATVNRSLSAGNEDNFYLNGSPFASSYVFSNNLDTAYGSNRFYIGDASGSGAPYKGDIASVQVYNRALSPSEVLQNFNATRGRFGI